MARQEAAMTIRTRVVVVSFVLASTVGALCGPTPAANLDSVDSQTVLRSLEDAFVSVADRVTPSVVNVSVKAKRAGPEGEAPERQERFREFFGPEFFERFFRRRPPREDTRA